MTQSDGLHVVEVPKAIAVAVEAACVAAQAYVADIVSGSLQGNDLLEAYDEGTATLRNAADQLALLSQVHVNAVMRTAAIEGEQVLRAELTNLSLNRAAYDRLSSLELPSGDADTDHSITRLLVESRLAGVDRDPDTRRRAKE